MNVEFEWDPVKAANNLRKHGISFDMAMRVFADPFALVELDRVEDGEQRWQTLGLAEGHVLVLVAHTIRDEDDRGWPREIIRIISARAADRKERRQYEQEHR